MPININAKYDYSEYCMGSCRNPETGVTRSGPMEFFVRDRASAIELYEGMEDAFALCFLRRQDEVIPASKERVRYDIERARELGVLDDFMLLLCYKTMFTGRLANRLARMYCYINKIEDKEIVSPLKVVTWDASSEFELLW